MLRVLAPRVLALLLLALVGVALTGPTAQARAPRCEHPTTKQAAKAADVVFVGTLTGGDASNASRYMFDAERLYSGDLATDHVVVRASGRCALSGLHPDKKYVVFAREHQGSLVTGVEDGTTRATAKTVRKVEKQLGDGRSLTTSGSEQGEVTYTRAEGAAPPRFRRIAAPGAALVIIGLLGLLVVRRRA